MKKFDKQLIFICGLVIGVGLMFIFSKMFQHNLFKIVEIVLADTNILSFAGSIIGGVVGGLLTLLGVNRTIRRTREDKFVDEFARKYKDLRRLQLKFEEFCIDSGIDRNYSHVKRMTIDNLDLKIDLDKKLGAIKELAANIDSYTYYLIEDYETFLIDELDFFFAEVSAHDIKILKENRDPDEVGIPIPLITALYEELLEMNDVVYNELEDHKARLRNKYLKYNKKSEPQKVLWSRHMIDNFNNRETDKGWDRQLSEDK